VCTQYFVRPLYTFFCWRWNWLQPTHSSPTYKAWHLKIFPIPVPWDGILNIETQQWT
jgi:hypothetical protein